MTVKRFCANSETIRRTVTPEFTNSVSPSPISRQTACAMRLSGACMRSPNPKEHGSAPALTMAPPYVRVSRF